MFLSSVSMEFDITDRTYAPSPQAFNLEYKLRVVSFSVQLDLQAALEELHHIYILEFHGPHLQIFGGFVAEKFCRGSISMRGRTEKIYRQSKLLLR